MSQEALLACLPPEEHERYQSYGRADDRQRFLVGRASLRELLGHWLHRSPGSIQLQAGPHGKPHCHGGPEFNVSHSGDFILLAFHIARPVGVDVEQEKPGRDWQPIARRVLPVADQEALLSLPATEQERAFLQLWCRLEARLKALGAGLAGLERWNGSNARIAGPLSGTLWDVQVPPGHLAAVAFAETP